MTEASSRVRLSIIGVIIAALFFGLLARLWFLQVTTSASYAAQTQANRFRTVQEPGSRGNILDRQGRFIVQNRLITSIDITRGLAASQLNKTVHNLAVLMGVRDTDVWSKVHNPQLTAYQPIPIQDDAKYELLVAIRERPEQFPGVIATQRTVRTYPYGAFAAHLLGYVGAVNAQDLKLHKSEGYSGQDVIGKDGVEQVFEHELRGTPHVRKLEVDSRGRIVQVLSDVPAKAGNDVQLSMDLDLQRVAEQSLSQGIAEVKASRDTAIKDHVQNFAGTGGAAVVLNARDGSVLALASLPTYPIDQFTNGIPANQFQTYTDPKNNFPLIDRATQGLYPPGSTFKLITAIAALQNGIATPSTSLQDNGCFTYAARLFCNAGKTKHGVVDLAHAIEVSSDLYFYNLGFFFWDVFHCGQTTCPLNSTTPGDKVKGYGIQNTAKQFGFGRPSGVGLPQEAAGRIPDEAFKQAINKNSNDQFAKQWVIGDSANVATGQGDVLVTPLQLADAYAAFANGGTLYSPRLASEVRAPGVKTALRQLPSQVVNKVDLKPETRAAIMPGLAGAVGAPDGTATAAFRGYKGIPMVGKTGTAQQSAPNEDTAWFAAIVNPDPTDANQPQYIVVVTVEQAGFGGTVAAPIARRIIEALNGNGNPGAVQISPPQTD